MVDIMVGIMVVDIMEDTMEDIMEGIIDEGFIMPQGLILNTVTIPPPLAAIIRIYIDSNFIQEIICLLFIHP